MKKRIPMTTEDRRRNKMETRNQDSMENLPTNLKSRTQRNLNDPLTPQVIFCWKCKKDIPINYFKQHQKNHGVLHIDYLRKRYDEETRILE